MPYPTSFHALRSISMGVLAIVTTTQRLSIHLTFRRVMDITLGRLDLLGAVISRQILISLGVIAYFGKNMKKKAFKRKEGSSNQETTSGIAASKGAAALKVWWLAKEIGVNAKESDSTYVSELQMLEERDQQVKVIRGGISSAP